MMLSKNFIPFLMILVQMGPSFAHDGEEHSPASLAVHTTKIRKCVRKPKAVISTPESSTPPVTPRPDYTQVPKDLPQQAPPAAIPDSAPQETEPTVELTGDNEVIDEAPQPKKVEEKPEEKPQAPTPSQGNVGPMDPRYVPADVLREINQIRARSGKAPMELDDKLGKNAYDQARYQSDIKKLTHDRPGGVTIRDQLVSIGFTPGTLAENAAAGVYTSHDAVNSWEGSAPHLENILGDYKYMGTAMIDGYATTVFANKG